MTQRLFPAAKISESLGLSRQYVNRYCKENCPEAKIGTKIDINNPVMRTLFESKGVNPDEKLKQAKERSNHLATTPVTQSVSKVSMAKRKTFKPNGEFKSIEDIDVSEHGHLSLNEIAEHFGTDDEYRSWLDAKKKQVDIAERELKIKEHIGELVSREFVHKYLFGLIEEMNSRLLVDSAVTIATKVYACCESGDSIEEATKIVRDEISKPIKGAKAQVTNKMNAL